MPDTKPPFLGETADWADPHRDWTAQKTDDDGNRVAFPAHEVEAPTTFHPAELPDPEVAAAAGLRLPHVPAHLVSEDSRTEPPTGNYTNIPERIERGAHTLLDELLGRKRRDGSDIEDPAADRPIAQNTTPAAGSAAPAGTTVPPGAPATTPPGGSVPEDQAPADEQPSEPTPPAQGANQPTQ